MAVTAFLVNLLCSVVSCDVKLPTPEIVSQLSAEGSSVFTQVLGLDPYVDTRYGGLEGYVMRTARNRRIYAFEGIPYAEPAMGYGRFRNPFPKEPWVGTRSAKSPGPECMQLNVPKAIRVIGSEDCLYLNVYTPQVPYIDEKGKQVFFEPFPVIVTFHGGGYLYGSGHELGPSYLLDRDVILVTLNFRLGILGFLSSGDGYSTGNFGLKDQAMAIQWIYENIASFGGDPDRITLMGQDSGAAAIHLHLIANQTTQYFKSGVSLSGSAFCHWAINSQEEAKRLTHRLAHHVNCPVQNSYEMMDCLRQTSAIDLVSAQFKLLEWSPFPSTLFAPVIEIPGPGAYLTKKPEAVYSRGEVERKPWIFGLTAHEGYTALWMLKSLYLEGHLRSKWKALAPIYLDYRYTSSNVTQTTNKLTRFYFGLKSPMDVAESKIAAVFGDRHFLPGVYKGIQAHSAIAPTYAYIFGFKGKHTLGNSVGRDSTEWGTGHSEDLFYYFNSTSWLPGFSQGDKDELAMSSIMTSILANMASKGEPLITQPNKVNVRLWEPVSPRNIQLLQLNKELKMIPQPYRKRFNFWLKLAIRDPKLLNPIYDTL